MPISEYQLRRCLDVMEKLKRLKISEFFLKPLDQATENLPADYSQKISKIIDLSIIQNNLMNRSYSSVEDWKKDISILWQNFFNIFQNNDPQYLMAKQLQESFYKLSEYISDKPAQDWETELSVLKDNFLSLSRKGPKSIFGDAGYILGPTVSSTESVSSTKKRTSNSTRTKKKQVTNPENQTVPVLPSLNEQAKLEKANDSVPLDAIDTTKLQQDIESVATDENMPIMLNIIKENESSFQSNESDEVEVDLAQLSNKTLKLLRNYIDSLLEKQKHNLSN
ncbi:hypothetical protein M9Y10_008396 [Tritrichomonas musculus]|uniref:Bromodomain containing protein n=1 Tax=Tritrichomonas musculus TaxID=1915356 RepID=A0ABR2IYS7_9EUKA